MGGNSHAVRPESGRRDEKESSRCALRQNSDMKEMCGTTDISPRPSRYVPQRTDAAFEWTQSASHVLAK